MRRPPPVVSLGSRAEFGERVLQTRPTRWPLRQMSASLSASSFAPAEGTVVRSETLLADHFIMSFVDWSIPSQCERVASAGERSLHATVGRSDVRSCSHLVDPCLSVVFRGAANGPVSRSPTGSCTCAQPVADNHGANRSARVKIAPRCTAERVTVPRQTRLGVGITAVGSTRRHTSPRPDHSCGRAGAVWSCVGPTGLTGELQLHCCLR